MHTQHSYISLPLFCMSKACNLLVTRIYFMKELAYVLSKNFVASVSVHFSFFQCHSFSPCWWLAFLIFSLPLWNFHQQNFSPLFSSTCSSCFSVIHMSVDKKRTSVIVKWRAVQYICLGPLASLWESHCNNFFEIAVFKLF